MSDGRIMRQEWAKRRRAFWGDVLAWVWLIAAMAGSAFIFGVSGWYAYTLKPWGWPTAQDKMWGWIIWASYWLWSFHKERERARQESPEGQRRQWEGHEAFLRKERVRQAAGDKAEAQVDALDLEWRDNEQA
jgi:hypothetical protein